MKRSLDEGVPVHVVAARCGHDPAVLLAHLCETHPQGRHQRGRGDWRSIEGDPWLRRLHQSPCFFDVLADFVRLGKITCFCEQLLELACSGKIEATDYRAI